MQREREVKKMWMTYQECPTSEQEGGGGPNPFLSCSFIADLVCNVGAHAHTHTHQNY